MSKRLTVENTAKLVSGRRRSRRSQFRKQNKKRVLKTTLAFLHMILIEIKSNSLAVCSSKLQSCSLLLAVKHITMVANNNIGTGSIIFIAKFELLNNIKI